MVVIRWRRTRVRVHARTLRQLQVYLVFRSGGKPAEDTIYMGAKSSGAKFITRSQPKTFTNNPSSSSTAQIDPDTGERERTFALFICVL